MVAAALCVALSFLGPLWSLRLGAPQYPEGLRLHVYAHRLGGRIDIINSLNHYIGMKPIAAEDFPEFRYLPPVFAAGALLMVAAAASGRRWLAGALVCTTPALLVLLYDLYRWLYQYGHQLDPAAPIRIEPFMPPVLGWNRLANFTTLSYFNWGALLFLAGIALTVWALVRSAPERRSKGAVVGRALRSAPAGRVRP